MGKIDIKKEYVTAAGWPVRLFENKAYKSKMVFYGVVDLPDGANVATISCQWDGANGDHLGGNASYALIEKTEYNKTGADRFKVVGLGAEQSIFDNKKQTTICKCFSQDAAQSVCTALNEREERIEGGGRIVFDAEK